MYVVGQKLKLQATFKVGEILTDPTTVVFKLLKPDTTITTLTFGVDGALVKASTGVFYMELVTVLEGTHTYRFEGTGTCPTAAEAVFATAYSPF